MVVGIKEPKEVTVYPLSFADARKLKALILGTLHSLSEFEEDSLTPVRIGAFVVSVIEENISTLMKMVLSETVEDEDLSIEQVSEVVNHIYTQNEQAIKNFYGLWSKVKKNHLEPKAESK
jgi:hypothetical protein